MNCCKPVKMDTRQSGKISNESSYSKKEWCQTEVRESGHQKRVQEAEGGI